MAEEINIPVSEINLPNGSTLLVQQTNGQRIIMYIKGMSIGAEILPENEFEYGSDAWANKEIELYSDALEIDLKIHSDFIKSCLKSGEVFTKPQIIDNQED